MAGFRDALRSALSDPRDVLVGTGTALLCTGLSSFGWRWAALGAAGVLLYVGLVHPLLVHLVTRRS